MNRYLSILALIVMSVCTGYNTNVFAADEDKALDFSLNSLNESKVSLSDFKGKKSVLLFFWATWCPFCRAELKELIKYYPQLKKDNIEVLAIDVAEPKQKVEKFLNNLQIDFTVLLDSEGEVSEIYRVRGIPTYFLINKRANIVYTGHTFPEDYQNLLNEP